MGKTFNLGLQHWQTLKTHNLCVFKASEINCRPQIIEFCLFILMQQITASSLISSKKAIQVLQSPCHGERSVFYRIIIVV